MFVSQRAEAAFVPLKAPIARFRATIAPMEAAIASTRAVIARIKAIVARERAMLARNRANIASFRAAMASFRAIVALSEGIAASVRGKAARENFDGDFPRRNALGKKRESSGVRPLGIDPGTVQMGGIERIEILVGGQEIRDFSIHGGKTWSR